MLKLLSRVAIGLITTGVMALPALAQQARLGDNFATATPPVFANQLAPSISVSAIGPLTVGSLTPAYGALALGVSPESAINAAQLVSSNPLVATDFSASYKAELHGSQFGLSAGYSGGSSLFTAAPTAGFNVGASVGYAGFYLHAGISADSSQSQRLTGDPKQGWLAGFGYQAGALNVRLSYMTAQSLNTSETDSRTWMIGGIYQLSSRLRLNADAFTSREPRAVSTPVTTTNATAPQGTGARVGVQLRF